MYYQERGCVGNNILVEITNHIGIYCVLNNVWFSGIEKRDLIQKKHGTNEFYM